MMSIHYARHYHACEGNSLHTLTLHPLYAELSPLQRLCLDIERTPNRVERGLAFLLVERIADYVIISVDVEPPSGYALFGGIEVTLQEGLEAMYGTIVPPAERGAGADARLHTWCETLLALAHTAPASSLIQIPSREAQRYHPAWPTRQVLRSLLQYARAQRLLFPLGAARRRTLKHRRREAIQARMQDVRPAANMLLLA
jgi:hypothetical protein